jgi:Aldo/keto reductase family
MVFVLSVAWSRSGPIVDAMLQGKLGRGWERHKSGSAPSSDKLPHVTATTRPLGDGHAIPLLGLGVWQIRDGPECVDAVRWALELGYRHVDTAQAYGNEESVGEALRESGIARDEVFVTTKFNPRQRDPVAAAEQSLRRLGLDHVDLYIVHWPHGGPTWASAATPARSASPTSASASCGRSSRRRACRRR